MNLVPNSAASSRGPFVSMHLAPLQFHKLVREKKMNGFFNLNCVLIESGRLFPLYQPALFLDDLVESALTRAAYTCYSICVCREALNYCNRNPNSRTRCTQSPGRLSTSNECLVWLRITWPHCFPKLLCRIHTPSYFCCGSSFTDLKWSAVYGPEQLPRCRTVNGKFVE